MGVGKYLLLFLSLASFLYFGDGCSMEGVGNWLLTQDAEVLDVHRGTFWRRSTSNIESMVDINVGGSVNFASYLNVALEEDGNFTISTSDGYELYEENETSDSISFTVNFLCTGGTTNSLIFSIRVQDTNNNPPTFRPTDQYEFIITPPLPPNFRIPGDDIIVRDIDLTTSRIDFTIENNSFFEVAYEGRSTTDPKEFLASLRTTDLIRNLSEDLELRISATDVDATGDPPITTYATIRVKADESFIFPEEPVFAQPFYLATYTNNQVVLEREISLRQGYDDEVTFSLEGEHSDYFEMVRDGNSISIEATRVLSNEILRSGRVILVVRAERVYTSGGAATVIVQLPEVLGLEFEQTQYEGRIVDNVLESLQLTLIYGYEEGFEIEIQNEHASSFSTSVQGNVITLLMTPLTTNVINENNFINLRVVVSNEFSTGTAVVTLDIIKDDNVSPAFEKAIYTGEYERDTGLAIEQITLQQGYDESVSFVLLGEHLEYFSISNVGSVITLATSGVPTQIWTEHQLLLTIEARKPRAVTATTAVSIQLPAARELAFEELTYSGTLENNTINLETIVLSTGYATDVNFTLIGDYATYFSLTTVQNEVTINLSENLPDNVITENNFLTLTLSASAVHAVQITTTVLLEIIKQDLTTPVFTENIYAGSYLGPNSIDIGNIALAQGYDNSVSFRLDGEHAQYFQIANVANNLNLQLVLDVPPEIIFSEKVLLFSIIAEKPLTVGANAAISISFSEELTEPTVMRFSQNTYVGFYEDTLSLENIVIETGYENGTELSLTGEHASYFQLQNEENVISIETESPFPDEILENNEFIILEVTASRERAISVSASVVIEIKKKEIVVPVFSNAYYKSVLANGSLEALTITLSEGYDNTVTFELQGDSSTWFSISNNENIVTLALNTSSVGPIPEDILSNNDYFLFSIVANKPDTISARAAIFIHIPKETPETILVQFTQTSYVGRIENGELFAPTLTLVGEREPIYFEVTGEHAQFFEVTQISSTNVQFRLRDGSLPENINELSFIIINIEAQYPEAISGHTTVILEVIRQPDLVTPVFEQAYYTGEYSGQDGLQFEQSIRLSQGFDESVVFTLAGDDAIWFELNNTAENSYTLVVRDDGLAQIRDRSHLLFSIVASKTGSVAGNSAIVINLSDFTKRISLKFAQDFYLGLIENNSLTIENIIMEEGYSPDLNITFTGDHVEYFQLMHQEGIFTLQLLPDLPANITDNILVFTIEAKIEDTRTHTTIVLELIKTELTPLAFEEAYYVGSYSMIGGFTFDPQIALSEGFDETVSFSLEGDDSQWFGFIENQYPLILTQNIPIPNDVILNNQQLIFVIVAERSGNQEVARSTVIISIIDDTTVLEFERNIYLGTIQENDLSTNIDTINLTKGYSENVTFSLLGELQSYFSLTREEASISITLQTSIPNDLIPNNGVILLELQASAPQAISAYTTLVFGIVRKEITSLRFNAIYYTGVYDSEGLDFPYNIFLTEGDNENVQFSLEGDDSQFFEIIEVENNIMTLRLHTPIPTELIINHRPLIFTIRANRTEAENAWATVVITLIDESETTVLRFDGTTYLGTLENNTINLDSITLSEGYNPNVTFSLQGGLESYFSITNSEAVVSIILNTPIPENDIPDNGIIILELQASAPNAVSAYATIIFVVKREDIVLEHPVFSNPYYTGQYSETDGLNFNDAIELVEGYDETVQFSLEGDDSQYFELNVTENWVSIRVRAPIPTELLNSKQHFVFLIRADKPNTTSAKATIVIGLLNEATDTTVLRFNRISYLGSLENNDLNLLEPISLREDNIENVTYSLDGDLSVYFTISDDEGIIKLTLEEPIPENLVPENRLIILDLQAIAPQAIAAYTAIIIHVQQDDIQPLDQLIFNEPYYTGRYTETEGLIFANAITLAEGYDQNVTFTLEGDSAQYFGLVIQSENSAALYLTSLIPSAVVMNNQHLIFTIRAERPGAITGRATIVIALFDEYSEDMTLLGFDRINYAGSLDNNNLTLNQITLSEGYSQAVSFRLFGELENYFALTSDGAVVTIALRDQIPDQLIPDNRIIILELEATAIGTMSARATIVIEVVQEEITPALEQLVLSENYYTGNYTEADGLTFTEAITLIEGYDENVSFVLEGESAQYFSTVISDNSVMLSIATPIPSAVVMNNHQLIFTIRAEKPGAIPATATVVISLLDDYNEDMNLLGFDRISYMGSIEGDTINLVPITLSEGYSEAVTFRLLGDLSNYFTLDSEQAVVTITLNNPISEDSIPESRIILLELEASAPDALSAHAAIVIEVFQEDNILLDQLSFSNAFYTGVYTEVEGLKFEDYISLTEGYENNVTFTLEGDDAQYFEPVVVSENSITLRLRSPIPSAVVTNNNKLIFTIRASISNVTSTRATIVISLNNEYTETTPVLGFNQISYIGSMEGDVVNAETIILSEGYSSNVVLVLHGDLQSYFTLIRNDATIIIALVNAIPEELVPSNKIIVLEIQASALDAISAHATIVLEVVQDVVSDVGEITFAKAYYIGNYTAGDGLTFTETITISRGYDDSIQFSLEGDHAQLFQLNVLENSVLITLASSIPVDVMESNRKLIFLIVAQRPGASARTTIIISLVDAWFEKVLYEGILQGGEVHHEAITLSGYDGTNIQLLGENAELFSASFSEGVVTILGNGSVTLSPDVTHVALELQAGLANAVLLLDVIHTDESSDLPSVSFDSLSYILRTDVTHTGPIGRVRASADTDERVVYSLAIDNAHLLQRISVSDDGEIVLWSPANSGVYSFHVIATTAFSKVSASVPVHLTVEAITIWEDGDYVLPPLQILDRDEESAHENLVPFNATAFEGCRFSLNNRWPAEQSWLYVDETGLHANAIDREYESIAFMALSQIQVELILQCDSDSVATRSKRSLDSQLRIDQLEHLGPYDYGNSKWIITDSINHNPRRSLVNLIVNDINDNYPIFIGKENEPIVVGYPVPELEERILPRALIEVKATDADVGENAALVYWSTEETLAVSPTTGSVHVRNIAGLENDMIVVVSATDRNGQGLTSSLDILVKLVDTSHIAVMTVKDAFLDDEEDILRNLTEAVGYEVKALRSAVISDADVEAEAEEVASRKKREATISTGGSLQLYVYGLIEREPVAVERLSGDINTSVTTVMIASMISLEDHLENLAICPLLGRDTALFVSTIVLAVLLFILIVVAAVWFFLKWRKKDNYEEMSDENSLTSRNDSVPPVNGFKPEPPLPRMNFEDLKRSERKLQERLEAPVDAPRLMPQPAPQPTPQPTPQTSEKPVESKVNVPELPMVIQSFDKLKDADESDDEDEFGERKKNRRKSVVTFNENVEKIIHVEEPPDDSDFEVYRL